MKSAVITKLEDAPTPAQISTRETLTLPQGNLTLASWKLDGIKLDHVHAHFTEPTAFPASRNDDLIRVHFGLKGDCDFHHHQLGQQFKSIGKLHNIMYSEGFDIEVQNKSLEVETFGIQFDKAVFLQFTQHANDQLKHFADAILVGKSSLLSPLWPIVDLPIRQVIHQIIHCKYEGEFQRLFLLSKSMELLVLAAEAHLTAAPTPFAYVKRDADKDRLLAAKELIDTRLTDPPSLSEICKRIGINEYKLKRGFKEMFGTTVFGYLTDQRLGLALQAIRDTQQSIAEIAYELGYATPQHFNNAFKKKYGLTPLLVRKNPSRAIH